LAGHNPAVEVPRNDFTYVLRGKIQALTSNLACKLNLRKFDPEDFKVEHMEFLIPGIGAAFRGYRILQISDVHYGQWISWDRLNGVINLINENAPDLVAITGDFVSYLIDNSMEDAMVSLLRKLKPNDRTVAVLGNHDHWASAERVHEILERSNIYDISNDVYVVSRGNSKLYIAGVDSVTAKKDRLDLVLEKMSLEGPAILLSHEPDFALKSAATKRFSLQLSGHSHGGQFVVPELGTPFRGHLFMKYPLGEYKVGEMIQYTNRGLGTNAYWIRINCPPEITAISLV
jgi:predicted MPP superfamily phosphohydrolase